MVRGLFGWCSIPGATSSEITAEVASVLGLMPDAAHHVLLRGVVGSATVPVVQVQSLTVGDLSFGRLRMPIVPDALGGADGILGTDGMANRRILIDFNHDRITIARSHRTAAPPGYVTIPFQLMRKELLVADAWVGNIRTKAIIDTGGQATIANLALREALNPPRSAPRRAGDHPGRDSGDSDRQQHRCAADPAGYQRRRQHDQNLQRPVDLRRHAHLRALAHDGRAGHADRMDTLGRLGVLIIDYRRRELQMQLND